MGNAQLQDQHNKNNHNNNSSLIDQMEAFVAKEEQEE